MLISDSNALDCCRHGNPRYTRATGHEETLARAEMVVKPGTKFDNLNLRH